MINGVSVSLVLPCRNEEHVIEEVLRSIPPGVDEIIVVDNCSTDKTAQVAKNLGAVVVTEPRTDNGIGYGWALRAGFAVAKGDVIITMDADGTYPAESIPQVIHEFVAHNLDFMSCSRIPRREQEEKLFVRIFGVLVLNVCIRVLYGYPVHDSLTGMVAVRKEKLSSMQFVEGGWDFCLELKLKSLTTPDIHFAEMHVPYHDRIVKASKQQIFKTGFAHLFYLFRYRLQHVNARTTRDRIFLHF